MEALIPLLILGAGVLYSVFKGSDENKEAEPRNIDKGRLNNPNRTQNAGRPTTTRTSPNRDSNRGRGLLGDLREELEKGLKEFETERTSQQQTNSDKGPIERRRAQYEQTRDSGRRIAQDTYQRSRTRVQGEFDTIQDTISGGGSLTEGAGSLTDGAGSLTGGGNEIGEFSRQGRQATTREPRNREAANRPNRYTSSVERVSKSERGMTREQAEKNRYTKGSDLIRNDEIGSYEFEINRKTVLDGVIFSEILNQPKSRK